MAFLQSAGFKPEVVEVPEFARGLAGDVVVLSVEKRILPEDLAQRGLNVCGVVPYYRSKREIPQAAALGPAWKEALGDLRAVSIRKSLTDPARLHAHMVTAVDMGFLIPIMAKMIRGGVFDPHGPLLAFEEEHRLIAVSGKDLVISRADDLPDFWIMLRTMVELTVAAWNNQDAIEAETDARLGIGTVEIFRRLPGHNCGQCQRPTCMEFATGLLTGSCSVVECLPVMEGDARYLESLRWLLGALGLDRTGEQV